MRGIAQHCEKKKSDFLLCYLYLILIVLYYFLGMHYPFDRKTLVNTKGNISKLKSWFYFSLRGPTEFGLTLQQTFKSYFRIFFFLEESIL